MTDVEIAREIELAQSERGHDATFVAALVGLTRGRELEAKDIEEGSVRVMGKCNAFIEITERKGWNAAIEAAASMECPDGAGIDCEDCGRWAARIRALLKPMKP